MSSSLIVAGSKSQVLASRVAKEGDWELAEVEYERFPDGERLVRVPRIKDAERAVIVASTPTDSSWIELLQLVDACSTTARTDLVIPYMGYARQDAEFEEGEAVTARALARAVAVQDVDSVTTINVHEPDVLNWFDSDGTETRDIDASRLLGQRLKNEDMVSSPVVVSPDSGAIGIAESVAGEVGGEADYLEKTRLSGDEVEIKPKNVDVDGRDVIIVDDMVATGGTMSEAIGLLRDQGAATVYAACVHPVFARNAVLRLSNAGVEEIITTDTLESSLETVSVAGLIAESLN